MSAQAALQQAFAGAPAPAELRRRLGALPGEELPNLFRLAVEGRLASSRVDEFLVLDGEQLATVRLVLAGRPRRETLAFLEGLTRAPLELGQRLEAQRLLAAIGEDDNLRLLLRLSLAAEEPMPLELRGGFRVALAEILRRDAQALEQVQGLLADSPPALAAPLVEAVSDLPGARATEVLARLLGRVPALDGLLLARLGQRGRLAGSASEFVFEAVRRYLHHGDDALTSAAARAAAELGDDAAVEDLVGLLESPDERVRAAVFRALAVLSGFDFGSDVTRWNSWYHAEMLWWDHEADDELERVERTHGREFVRAARVALEHRLYRDRIAEAFLPALARRDVEEARLACQALRELRSPIAVAALLECLQRGEPRLEKAAREALRAITGQDVAEVEAWGRQGG